MPPPVIALNSELREVTDHWSPRVVAELNGQYLKVVKAAGEFVWHQHDQEDELFLVLKGALRIEFEDGAVALGEGECCVVPRGVRHRPVAEEECWLALFEPVATDQTGGVADPRRRTVEEQRRR